MSGCKFNGRENPRVLPGRHEPDCATDECPGCQPCEERHCSVCWRVHADGACAECIAATRDDLRSIAELCGALPEETLHRGVESEAAMLWGPTADPEAWRNRAMSAMRGRLDDAYLEDCRDEQHPLWVLGTWEQAWRDHLDQPTELAATLPRLVDYLDRHMHEMAEVEDVPFEDFARDLRGCRGHVQAVLHDESRGDVANVGCFDCGGRLERRFKRDRVCRHKTPARAWWAVIGTYPEIVTPVEEKAARMPCEACDPGGFEDNWTCGTCRREYTPKEYNFALRAALEESA